MRLRRSGGRFLRELRILPSRVLARTLQVKYALPEISLDTLLRSEIAVAPPILDGICLPPYLGTTDHDDFLPLMKIARSLNPRIVVELGTAYGNLVANICAQCPSAKVYSVNALPSDLSGSRMVTFRLDESQIGRVYRDHGFANRVVQILKNTLDLDLSDYLEGPVVDLAIVDACHDTDYVVNDFLTVAPFVRDEGVVLLHDTHGSLARHLWSSYLACMLLRRRGYDVKHLTGTWWGVWVRT